VKPPPRPRVRAGAKTPKAPAGAEQSRRSSRGQTLGQAGQLAALAVVIILGLVGFAVHFLWIAVIVLLAVLWGHMASKFRGSRTNRDAASDVVSAVGDQMRGLADSASSALSDVGRHSDSAED
jgi:hypothetical protein